MNVDFHPGGDDESVVSDEKNAHSVINDPRKAKIQLCLAIGYF
jgi:hypothetical protein